jgi:hypothetical protein
VKLGDLLKQRMRWDGDLLFLYARKHRHSLNPQLMGWPNFITTLTYGLFVQTVLPFIILIDSTSLILQLEWQKLTLLTLSLYAAYLLLSTLQFSVALMLCSERPARDFRLMPLLLIFPVAMFAMRCWSAVAMLNELLRRGHEETAMAPWWVISRAHRF